MTTYEFVEGWTAPILISLKSRGRTPDGTMLGMSAELVLKDRSGAQVNTSGDVTISDSANWQVQYTPDPSDFVAGSYHGRFKITDGNGKVAYFPSDSWDVWHIRTEA